MDRANRPSMRSAIFLTRQDLYALIQYLSERMAADMECDAQIDRRLGRVLDKLQRARKRAEERWP